MGVSFKVSKTGTRFRPKAPPPETSVDEVAENPKESSRIGPGDGSSARKLEGGAVDARGDAVGSENEVSFSLNLFSDGYSIGKPSQDPIAHHDIPKDLHPYDRRSETLFSAIECGRLPGDILDDIPCKFVDGTLVCEVRDYRKYTSEQGSSASSSDESLIVTKINLKMSLENVVKDIPLISDNSWTYGDLMEVESRILNSLQPQLCLDPAPKLDRLSNVPVHAKLNLGQCSLRMKRLRQAQEITITSNNKSHGKKICIDRVPESSNMMPHHVPDNVTVQNHNPSNMLPTRPRNLIQDPSSLKYHAGVGGLGGVSVSGASPVSQDMMMSYTDNMNPGAAHLHGKREHAEGPMSPLSAFNKRARLGNLGPDGIPSQQMGSHMDGLQGSDMNWRNTLLQQQALTRGIQLSNSGIQKYSQQVLHGVLNQDAASASFAAGQAGMRYVPKEEQFDGDKLDPSSQLGQGKNDMQVMEGLQQRLPQHGFMRSGFSQSAWNNLGQQFEKDLRKDDQIQKRKPVQSPRLSAGGLAQSPLSSKSGEFSSGSVAPHYGAVANTQKEKSAVTSVPTVGGAQSLTSSANDSLQRQYQIQAAAKRRSNSLPKTPVMSGVGSPVSVSNMSIPLNANSPSIGTPPLVDQTMLERFSKIEMVTMRHKLNCKKNKADDFPIRKPNNYSAQQLLTCLSNISINEVVKDDKRPLAKSLVGGSMNICKSRVLNFIQPERVVQGNVVSFVHKARTRMVMSEKLNGTVVMYYGDLKDDEFLEIEDYLPTLPNNHLADLLTAQFCHLMSQEGYLLEDHIQPKPTPVNQAANSLSNIPVTPTNNSAAEMSMSQYGEAVSGQQSGGEAPKPSNSGNASQSLVGNARMLPPVNSQALQMSQGLLSGVARPQQLDQQSSLQQQQQQQQNQQSLLQQQHQYQRSPMISPNQLSHLNAQGSNMQLGGHMVNKPSPLQLQLLQQQQQQQQASPQQMQRKMIMGLGTGAGSMGNSMIGLGGLGNTMGIGVARGVSGISAPMGNIGQNPMNLSQASNISNVISQQLRSGTLTPAQAALMQSKLRILQSRGNIIGAGAPQVGMSSGARQMNPGSNNLSMLGQSLNRANMNPMQRSMMGPPKMMQGMNLYMNQQQQSQQQQQQQQPQQQLQQQQQQQLQQLQQQQQLQPQQQQQQLQPQQQQQQQQLQQLQLQQQQLQQQQLQQQQQQQQPMQLQQQPMQLQQQETTSPLQAVLSPPQPYPQVGSPSTMGIPQQQASPQQMSQRTPMSPQQMNQRTPMSPQQLSSGAIHGTNPEACPASPQLSSQTLGSVGSITNSPMDMQGVNKSNSASNI